MLNGSHTRTSGMANAINTMTMSCYFVPKSLAANDMIHDPLIKLRITWTAIWRYAAPGRHYLNQVYALRMLTIQHCNGLPNVPASPPK